MQPIGQMWMLTILQQMKKIALVNDTSSLVYNEFPFYCEYICIIWNPTISWHINRFIFFTTPNGWCFVICPRIFWYVRDVENLRFDLNLGKCSWSKNTYAYTHVSYKVHVYDLFCINRMEMYYLLLTFLKGWIFVNFFLWILEMSFELSSNSFQQKKRIFSSKFFNWKNW